MMMTSSTTTTDSTSSFDRLAQAWQAQLTGGLSPASLLLAYLDWLLHLSSSPEKQGRLSEQAWRNALQFTEYALRGADPNTHPATQSRPQYSRFADSEWQPW